MNVVSLKRGVDLLIYLSVALGVILLAQIYFLVPTWLFYSVFVGWLAYLLVVFATAKQQRIAYPAAFVLSILTLAVSLPQPEHYAFSSEGMWVAALTFATGSVLQIALLVLLCVYFVKYRRSG